MYYLYFRAITPHCLQKAATCLHPPRLWEQHELQKEEQARRLSFHPEGFGGLVHSTASQLTVSAQQSKGKQVLMGDKHLSGPQEENGIEQNIYFNTQNQSLVSATAISSPRRWIQTPKHCSSAALPNPSTQCSQLVAVKPPSQHLPACLISTPNH